MARDVAEIEVELEKLRANFKAGKIRASAYEPERVRLQDEIRASQAAATTTAPDRDPVSIAREIDQLASELSAGRLSKVAHDAAQAALLSELRGPQAPAPVAAPASDVRTPQSRPPIPLASPMMASPAPTTGGPEYGTDADPARINKVAGVAAAVCCGIVSLGSLVFAMIALAGWSNGDGTAWGQAGAYCVGAALYAVGAIRVLSHPQGAWKLIGGMAVGILCYTPLVLAPVAVVAVACAYVGRPPAEPGSQGSSSPNPW